MTYDDIKTHRQYIQFSSKWEQILHCLEGEETIKAQGTRYLPYPVRVSSEDQTTDEFKDMYALFLEGAHFVEYTAEAVEDLVAAAFRKPLEVTDTQGNPLDSLSELDYLDLTDIGKEIISGVGAYGRQFMLVDYPTVETTPSMEEDTNNKAYVSLYNPLDVLNWIETKRSGKSELTRVVLREIDEVHEAEDEENATLYMYRELLIEEGQLVIKIYREDADVVVLHPKANGKPLTSIPGTFIGTTSNTVRVDKSPVMGIANSNIKHYQTWAELMWVQTYVGHPQLALTGLAAGWNKAADRNNLTLKMDASEILALEGEQANAHLLELNTNNLIHFRTLEVLEQSMSEQGARIKSISKKAGVESAEALKIRSSASMSKLASIVNNTQEAMTQALEWLGGYMGTNTAGWTVKINKEFFSPEPDGPLLTAISNAEVNGTAPRGTSITYLKQIELVDDSTSADELLKDMVLGGEAPMPNKQQQ